MYKNRCEGEGGKDRNEFVKIAFFLTIEKIVYTTKKSNLQVEDTDHMDIPRIFTIQKIWFSPNFSFRANQKNLLFHEKFKFYFTTYGSYGDSSYPHEAKNRVSDVICVENDAKEEEREKKENIRIFSPQALFRSNQKTFYSKRYSQF